jgi:DNA-binding beta-propeller fold protein YncE
LYVVSQDGQVYAIDSQTHEVTTDRSLELAPDQYVMWDGIVAHPEENLMYFAVGADTAFDAFVADSILALSLDDFSTQEYRAVGTITGIAVGPDGSPLVLDRVKNEIVEVDMPHQRLLGGVDVPPGERVVSLI